MITGLGCAVDGTGNATGQFSVGSANRGRVVLPQELDLVPAAWTPVALLDHAARPPHEAAACAP